MANVLPNVEDDITENPAKKRRTEIPTLFPRYTKIAGIHNVLVRDTKLKDAVARYESTTFSHVRPFNLHSQFLHVVEVISTITLKEGTVAIAVIFGPNGTGKTYLYNACSVFFPLCGICHILLPADICRQRTVESELAKVKAKNDEHDPEFCGEAVATYLVVEALRGRHNLAMNFGQVLKNALKNFDENMELRPNREAIVFMHDGGQCDEDRDSATDKCSPEKVKVTKPGSPTIPSMPPPPERNYVPESEHRGCPPVFKCEGVMSIPKIEFPWALSPSVADNALKESLGFEISAIDKAQYATPFILFHNAMMRLLDIKCCGGVLLSFSSVVAPPIEEKEGTLQLCPTKSNRRITFSPLTPLLGMSQFDECIHGYLRTYLTEDPNYSLEMVDIARLMGFLVQGGCTIADYLSILELVKKLRETPANILLEMKKLYFREPTDVTELGKENLKNLNNVFKQPEHNVQLVYKFLLSVLSTVQVSLTCGIVRLGVRQSVLRIQEFKPAGGTSVDYLSATIRVSCSTLHYLLTTAEKEITDTANKILANSDNVAEYSKGIKEIIKDLNFPELDYTHIDNRKLLSEGVVFGEVFETVLYSRTVFLVHCMRVAFDHIPMNCFPLQDLFSLGKRVDAESSQETILPVGLIINELQYFATNQFDYYLIIKDFLRDASDADGIRFLILRTAFLPAVDITIICDVVVRQVRSITVFLLQCKSSMIAAKTFEPAELGTLLDNGAKVFARIKVYIQAYSDYNRMEYCVQLMCREPSKTFCVHGRRPLDAIRIYTHSQCVSSSLLPGLVAYSGPNVYIKEGCSCQNLRDTLTHKLYETVQVTKDYPPIGKKFHYKRQDNRDQTEPRSPG